MKFPGVFKHIFSTLNIDKKISSNKSALLKHGNVSALDVGQKKWNITEMVEPLGEFNTKFQSVLKVIKALTMTSEETSQNRIKKKSRKSDE